ncbi:MAG: tetratricopeptide repeat protein [Candidatus Aenigmarchaeota archaeon]|nr:tetratricopeptide repeat protein [Candidatus Aenigmarchaeota archaeon]
MWWYGAALLERQQGHLIKAKEYARQATQLDPDNEQIKQFLNNIK